MRTDYLSMTGMNYWHFQPWESCLCFPLILNKHTKKLFVSMDCKIAHWKGLPIRLVSISIKANTLAVSGTSQRILKSGFNIHYWFGLSFIVLTVSLMDAQLAFGFVVMLFLFPFWILKGSCYSKLLLCLFFLVLQGNSLFELKKEVGHSICWRYKLFLTVYHIISNQPCF